MVTLSTSADLTRRIERVRVEGVVGEVQRIGRAPPSRAESVEAQPAGDDHQPPLGIVDAGDVRAGQPGECFLHHVLGVREVQQYTKGEIEHPSPVRLPERGEHRIVGAGRGVVRSFHRYSHRFRWRTKAAAGTHDFLRMPSCQINFSIDGLALGVATAIVERT